jgi:hypothetical protein
MEHGDPRRRGAEPGGPDRRAQRLEIISAKCHDGTLRERLAVGKYMQNDCMRENVRRSPRSGIVAA